MKNKIIILLIIISVIPQSISTKKIIEKIRVDSRFVSIYEFLDDLVLKLERADRIYEVNFNGSTTIHVALPVGVFKIISATSENQNFAFEPDTVIIDGTEDLITIKPIFTTIVFGEIADIKGFDLLKINDLKVKIKKDNNTISIGRVNFDSSYYVKADFIQGEHYHLCFFDRNGEGVRKPLKIKVPTDQYKFDVYLKNPFVKDVNIAGNVRFSKTSRPWSEVNLLFDKATLYLTDNTMLQIKYNEYKEKLYPGKYHIKEIQAGCSYAYPYAEYVFDASEIIPNAFTIVRGEEAKVINFRVVPKADTLCNFLLVIHLRKLKSLSLCGLQAAEGRFKYEAKLKIKFLGKEANIEKEGTVYYSDYQDILKGYKNKFVINLDYNDVPIGYYSIYIWEKHYYDTYDKKGKRKGGFCSDYYPNKPNETIDHLLILPNRKKININVPK